MDGFSMDNQAGDYQIYNLPGRGRTSSSPPPPQETELMDGLGEQAGAYRIMPLPSKATEGAGGNPTINFDAGGEAMDDVAYEVTGGSGEGKAIRVTGGGGGGVLVAGDDEVGQHYNFVDAEGRRSGGTTTFDDVARMKQADATVAEATNAAMKVAKEAADDVVAAGSKLL